MSPAPFTVEFIGVFIGTLLILHQYGNLRKQHFLVSLAVFVSWFFSFLIVFILPLDVSNSCYFECLRVNKTGVTCEKPWSFVSGDLLPELWRVIYWSSQILSWFQLPMMQSYVYAGAFSVWGKIKTAIYENALWYGSYLVIFGALLVYVALKPELNINADSLKLIGITASNTWGLLLLVLLVGYGLIELPRNAWNMSKHALRLDHSYFMISKLSTSKEDADEELAEVLNEVKKATEEITYNSNLRKYLNIIIDKCPDSSKDLFSKGTDDFVDYKTSNTSFTEKSLISLHKKVMVIVQRAHQVHVQWNAALQATFNLEDIERNKLNADKVFKSSFSDHATASIFKMKLKWIWEIQIKPWVFRILASILFLLSICLIWSESTFFSTNPVLSIFAILVKLTKSEYLYFQIELVSCLTIAYMCACTYYTVFQIKVFNFYSFQPNHETDANSLLFSGLLFCRLTYALCLNFLAMIHMDGHVTGNSEVSHTQFSETYFTKFMGHMDLLEFIAKGFNVYYPLVVLLVVFCTYFSIGKRMLHCIGVEQFLSDDDFSADYVREGKEIARREKRKIERCINGGEAWSDRSKTISEKYFGTQREVADNSSSRIDDGAPEEPLPVNLKTKLTINKPNKYSQRQNESDDKLNLVDNIEYAPADPVVKGSYQNIAGTSRKKVPRNIFDDA